MVSGKNARHANDSETGKITHPQMKLGEVEVWKENKLPVIDAKIEDFHTIQLLRQNNLIPYVEPMGYEPSKFEPQQHAAKTGSTGTNGSSCGGYTADNSLKEGLDYTTILPGTKQSWHYAYHGIPGAWKSPQALV